MTVSFRQSFVRDLKKLAGARIRERIREVVVAVEEANSLSLERRARSQG